MGGPGSGPKVKKRKKAGLSVPVDKRPDRTFRINPIMSKQLDLIVSSAKVEKAALYRYGCKLVIEQFKAGALDINAINALSGVRGRKTKTIKDIEAITGIEQDLSRIIKY